MGHKLKQEGIEILSTPDFVELKGMDSEYPDFSRHFEHFC